MTETEGRQWLKKLCKDRAIILQPIESSRTAIGIPDIYFRTPIVDGWIELKQTEMKMTSSYSYKIPFRPQQFEWLHKYSAFGGNAILCLFMQTEDSHLVFFIKRHNIHHEYTMKELTELSFLWRNIDNISFTDFYRMCNNVNE